MALVPHKITALAETDALGTDGRNIVIGALVSLYNETGVAVMLYDDENGSNGSTVKQSDSKGQVVVFVEPGVYEERISNGQRRKIIVNSIVSVFGRTAKEIAAQTGDYTASQITNDSSVIGASVSAALDNLVKPSDLSTVATSGSYNDLTDIPTGLGLFNIADYGAVADNATDNKPAIDAAIAALAAAGGGCLYIPPVGVFRTSGGHDVPSNMTVKGEGFNSCLKRTADDVGAMFSFIAATRPAIERENVTFDSVRIEGVFDETGASGTGNGIITLVGFRNITIHNCFFYDIETFCLNMNQCDNARVINNDFQRICRDIVGIWGTPNIIVANNSFIGGDDDCISLNQARFESTNDVMRDGLIVTNNYLRDTGAIKIQQAKNTIISNNVIKLCKGGSSIFLEGLASAQGNPDERNGNLINVIVENNIILDTLSRSLAYKPDQGGANERVGIKIDSKLFTIREYNAGYEYNYSDTGLGDIGPITECTNLYIRNNIVRRTVQPDGVKTYSELFGFGKMFSRFKGEREDTPLGYIDANGFVDPVIVPAHLEMRCMEVRDGVANTEIKGNTFQGSSVKCLWFNKDTWPKIEDFTWTSEGGGVYSSPQNLRGQVPSVYDTVDNSNLTQVSNLTDCQNTSGSFFIDQTDIYIHRVDDAEPVAEDFDQGITRNTVITLNLSLRNVVIKDNTFRDFKNVGIDLDDYVGSHQDVLITGNTFDADPYFTNSGRNSDGSWTTKVDVVCIEVKDQKGTRIIGNTFKNAAIPWSTGGGDNQNIVFRRNTFHGEPSLIATPSDLQVDQRGMGLFPFAQDPEMELVYVNSDPSSDGYLQWKGKQVELVNNVPPSQGYYFANQFVQARGTTPANGKILLGYKRVTNGNQHVLGTDWVPLYALDSAAP